MNTPLYTQAARGLAAFGIATGMALSAGAQPTGNPKGSAPPPSSDSQKAPAARTPTGGFGDSGKIVTEKTTAKAHTQTMRPPANTGPAQATPDHAPGRASSGKDAKGAGAKAGATVSPVPIDFPIHRE